METKKVTFLFICLFISFSLCAQIEETRYGNKAAIYCIDGKKRIQKQQLTSYLKGMMSKNKAQKIDYCKFIHLPDSLCNNRPPVKDSIQDIVRIINIEKKKDNFRLENGRTKKVKVNLIEVVSISDTIHNWNLLRIISENRMSGKKRDEIEIGEIYSLLLISCFDKDCCRAYYENRIIPLIGHATTGNIFINDTWICNLYSGFNYYTTPNLKGLYYIEPE